MDMVRDKTLFMGVGPLATILLLLLGATYETEIG